MSKASPVPGAEFLLYETEDGRTRVACRFIEDSLWLSQAQMAELFQVSVPTVNEHLKTLYAEGEIQSEATIRKFLIVRQEGSRQVSRQIDHYSLEAILSVGYRVRSARGTQFRQWATTHLREYLVKGFVMDDERMKDPAGWDYFDELLQRIREIRTSEKRFYQKVRDLFALSVDYKDSADTVGHFFAEVQNKMLYAVTQQTAAEIIVKRADPTQPNMALTAWKAGRVRKTDVIVAKNYLNAEEIDHLNRMVTAFLEFAELRTRQRKQLVMADWRQYVDSFIQFNESPLLKGVGRTSHDAMLKIVHGRYEKFDEQRRKAEAIDADSLDMKELEQVEKKLTKKGGRDAS